MAHIKLSKSVDICRYIYKSFFDKESFGMATILEPFSQRHLSEYLIVNYNTILVTRSVLFFWSRQQNPWLFCIHTSITQSLYVLILIFLQGMNISTHPVAQTRGLDAGRVEIMKSELHLSCFNFYPYHVMLTIPHDVNHTI